MLIALAAAVLGGVSLPAPALRAQGGPAQPVPVLAPRAAAAPSPAAPGAAEGAAGAAPGQGFDWTVKSGDTVFFNTSFQILIDAENGLVQEVENGVVLVDELTIEEGARVRAFGPFPLRILATGGVRIDGTLDVSGFPASPVQGLLLATMPQSGGTAGPGGGAGGVGSPETDMSSARGGAGDGPFGLVGFGGEGGESGYSGANDRNLWRPGGGGGGRFGPDAVAPSPSEPSAGLAAQPGFDGMDSTDPGFDPPYPEQGAFGAESDAIPPQGGAPGPGAFSDGDPENDFWGVKVHGTRRIRGELKQLAAGVGGGGGGDAISSPVFPTPQFQDPTFFFLTTNDRRGGGGGGGAGSLHVVSLGEIVFGTGARVLGRGGAGGAGENTFFIDRVGGGGGGGSGGHLVFESARRVVFEGLPQDASEVVSARGGAGGSGLPLGMDPEFMEIFNVLGYPVNRGGDGGPGVVQLHVPLPPDGSQAGNVVLPPGATLEDVTVPTAHVLLPIFLPPVAPDSL